MPETEVQPVIAPIGGLRYDLPASLLAETDMSDCRNVWLEDGRIVSRRGTVQFGNNLPLPGSVIGSDQFFLFAGADYLVVLTTKAAFKYVPADTNWETISETEVEDDCETTWTAKTNVTVADEGTIKKVGSYSQKVSPASAFTTGLMAYRDQALGDKSAYGLVRLWIRSSIAMSAGDLQFCIDNTAGCGSPTETLDIPALTADTWKLVFLECSDPASTMTAIASLGLKSTTDFGACDIYIDDIQFVKCFNSSLAYDANEEDLFSYDVIRKLTESEPWWVCTNNLDPIKKYTGTGSISNLISTFPAGVTALTARELLEFKNHLVLFDVTEDGNRYPQRVRWSDTGAPADFNGGNASYLDLSGSDWMQRGVKFKGDYVIIFKERSIWVGYATGDSSVFSFTQKVKDVGCAAPRTVEVLGEDVFYLGWEDVYLFDGISNRAIGQQIRTELFDTLNPGQLDKCFSVVIEEQKEVWLCIPSTAGDYVDMAWCYNWELDKWTRLSFTDSFSLYGYYEKQAGRTIGDLEGTIGEQMWRIGSRSMLSAMPVTLLGDIDGYVYEYDSTEANDDGTAIDSWFSTKDFNFTQLTGRFRIVRVDTFFTGTGVTLQYSLDKGVTWTTIATFGANNNLEDVQRGYVRLDASQVRFRWRNNSSGGHFSFARANIYWQWSGRRL
jgi:hypothetical protein